MPTLPAQRGDDHPGGGNDAEAQKEALAGGISTGSSNILLRTVAAGSLHHCRRQSMRTKSVSLHLTSLGPQRASLPFSGSYNPALLSRLTSGLPAIPCQLLLAVLLEPTATLI